MSEYKIEGITRILEKMHMAKIHRGFDEVSVEMTENDDNEIQSIIFEVLWENKDKYAVIYNIREFSEAPGVRKLKSSS